MIEKIEMYFSYISDGLLFLGAAAGCIIACALVLYICSLFKDDQGNTEIPSSGEWSVILAWKTVPLIGLLYLGWLSSRARSKCVRNFAKAALVRDLIVNAAVLAVIVVLWMRFAVPNIDWLLEYMDQL